jgi:hypothetical protein
MQAHRLGGIYEVRRLDGLRCRDIPSFMKVASGIQKLMRRIHRLKTVVCVPALTRSDWDGQVNTIN